MFAAIEIIRKELVVAQAQLESAKKAKCSTGMLSNSDCFELLQRIEYRRGCVDTISKLMGLLAKSMRKEAAEDLWRRTSQ